MKTLQMYKNLKQFTTSDLPAARQSLARVIIITLIYLKFDVNYGNSAQEEFRVGTQHQKYLGSKPNKYQENLIFFEMNQTIFGTMKFIK